jgi:AbrB family looped-hinge helix DNA binding protein
MSSTTVTSKGQITLPSHLRETFGIKAGDKIEFYKGADGALCARVINLTPEAFLNALPPLPKDLPISGVDMPGDALLDDDERIKREFGLNHKAAA